MLRLYRVVFWSAAGFALAMALLPFAPSVPGEPSDKFLHMVTFATLAVLAVASYRSTSLMRLLAGLSVFGALIEILQAIPTVNRDADPFDWVADTAAAALALAVLRKWRATVADLEAE